MSRPTGVTPSQTVGPFFSFALTEPWADAADAAGPRRDEAIEIAGRLVDGNGDPVADGLIETWQADPDGRFDHPDDPRGAVAFEGFCGFARAGTDERGRWRVRTLRPGRIPARDGVTLQAPHLLVSVMARGLLQRLVTRIYFGDEPDANHVDPVLRSLPGDARATLVAEPVGGRAYRFDIHLQGDDETAFFAL